MTPGASPSAFTSVTFRDTTPNPRKSLESQGVLPASARLFDDNKERKYGDFPKHWQCHIVSTFGIHDEVAAAAKEILRLAEDCKLQLHEIGVVARSLESYSQVVKDIFHQHRIPLAGTLEEPLVQFPLTKAVILLLNLPAKDFVRSQVIDLLSSPYFQFQNIDGNPASVRPDLWDLATRELAICKGVGRVAPAAPLQPSRSRTAAEVG